jgi:hypothetical protein
MIINNNIIINNNMTNISWTNNMAGIGEHGKNNIIDQA